MEFATFGSLIHNYGVMVSESRAVPPADCLLELQLLGPPRIRVNGTPVPIGRKKALALLVYVALSGTAHTRDSLATLLWPEHDQEGARGNLRKVLSELRGKLPGTVLGGEDDIVRLSEGCRGSADLRDFEKEIRELRRPPGRTGDAVSEADANEGSRKNSESANPDRELPCEVCHVQWVLPGLCSQTLGSEQVTGETA